MEVDASVESNMSSRQTVEAYLREALRKTEETDTFSLRLKKEKIFEGKKSLLEHKSRIHCGIVAHPRNPYLGMKSLGRYDFDTVRLNEVGISVEDLARTAYDILILNNNSLRLVGQKDRFLSEALPSTIVVIHDWDCHHWFEQSLSCALNADIYLQAHQWTSPLLPRIMPHPIHSLAIGFIQWSEEFIESRIRNLETSKRSDSPFGKYFFYPHAVLRNRIVATFSQHYGTVGWADAEYHSRSEGEKWEEWSGFKIHIVCPVACDLPIRFFDALISGGIPCVPIELARQVEDLGLPENFYRIYTSHDLVNLKNFVDNASDFFDAAGQIGMIERSIHTFRNYSPTVTMARICDLALRLLG